MTTGADAEVMPAGELKPLLMLSKRKPVSCAIGFTKDKDGVVLLDRRMKPRKLLAELKSKARTAGVELDTSSLRFGRAAVDAASDSSTVHFTVNKAAPGALRMKLLEKLKPAGFQRCDISVDEALENETEDEEEPGTHAPSSAGPGGNEDHAGTGGDTAAGNGRGQAHGPDDGAGNGGPGSRHPDGGMEATAGSPPSGSAAPGTAGEGAPTATRSGNGAPQPGTGAETAPDAAGLIQRLSSLVKSGIAAVLSNPGAADAIRTAAAKAKDALTSGDLAGAGQAMDAMEKLLEGPNGVTTAHGASTESTPSSQAGDHANGAAPLAAQTLPKQDTPGAASNDQPTGATPPSGQSPLSGQSRTPTRHQPGSPVFAKSKVRERGRTNICVA